MSPSSRLASQRARADDLLPPGARGVVAGELESPPGLELQLRRRPDHQQRPAHRIAAVREHDERTRHIAARAQVLDDLLAEQLLRVRGIAVAVLPRARRVDGDRALEAARRALRLADRPGPPTLEEVRELADDLAADQHVQAVAGL